MPRAIVRRAAAIMRALRARWLSSAEVVEAAGIKDPKACRAWLAGLVAERIIHMRIRAKEMGEGGEFPRGQYAREYRLRTDFGGLDDKDPPT